MLHFLCSRHRSQSFTNTSADSSYLYNSQVRSMEALFLFILRGRWGTERRTSAHKDAQLPGREPGFNPDSGFHALNHTEVLHSRSGPYLQRWCCLTGREGIWEGIKLPIVRGKLGERRGRESEMLNQRGGGKRRYVKTIWWMLICWLDPGRGRAEGFG